MAVPSMFMLQQRSTCQGVCEKVKLDGSRASRDKGAVLLLPSGLILSLCWIVIYRYELALISAWGVQIKIKWASVK